MSGNPRPEQFAICVQNVDYPASLELRKIYEVVPDSDAEEAPQIRIVDESGEAYLYPREYFVPIELPRDVKAALRKAS